MTLVGSIPLQSHITGFEVMHNNFLAATTDEIYSFAPNQVPLRFPIADHVRGLMVSSDRTIWVATEKGYGYVAPSGIQTKNLLAALNNTGLTLHNSGEASFLAIAQHGEKATLMLLGTRQSLALAQIPGPIRAVSWTGEGLAAVAGQALVTWNHNSSNLRIVAKDAGFETAQDTILLPDGSAVISLKNAVILYTKTGSHVISGYGGRVRFDGGKLYILDNNHAVWMIEGIEKLGDRQKDIEYARSLMQHRSGDMNDKSVMEAVRLVGSCSAANSLNSN